MGDGNRYRHSEQHGGSHYAESTLGTEWVHIGRELDDILSHAWQARSNAQEVRLVAAQRTYEAAALRQRAAELRREAERYRTRSPSSNSPDGVAEAVKEPSVMVLSPRDARTI